MATIHTPLTFAGTTLIGGFTGAIANGQGFAALTRFKPLSPNVQPAEFYGAQGLELLKVGEYNTSELTGVFEFGANGSRSTVCYYTDYDTAFAAVVAIQALRVGTPVGTLVFGSRTFTNCWFEEFEPSPPVYCGLNSNIAACVNMRLVFKRLG